MVTRDPNNNDRYVIIGGGLAGGSAAETLRQSGFTGEIVMLCAEDVLPYDRTILTKGNNTLLKITADNIKLRSQDFFDKIAVDVRTSTLVTKVDAKTKSITTKNGDTLTYDKLLVASGTSAIRPDVPGVNSKNVFTVRDINDAYLIREAIGAGVKNIVVVGGSYIGIETAGTIKMDLKDEVNVTVVTGGQELYHSTLGPGVGKAFR
jgi:apoptosis-inducing factor 3